MYDRDLVIEIFRQIHHACLVVMERFRPIRSVEDFTGSPAEGYPEPPLFRPER